MFRVLKAAGAAVQKATHVIKQQRSLTVAAQKAQQPSVC